MKKLTKFWLISYELSYFFEPWNALKLIKFHIPLTQFYFVD